MYEFCSPKMTSILFVAMVEVAVKRLGDEDQNGDTRHCVSLLSLKSSYALKHFNLPCPKDVLVNSMSCGGLLYFNDLHCNSFICNLRTGRIKSLASPGPVSPTNMIITGGSGLGYDASTRDYRVLRSFTVASRHLSGSEFCTNYTQLYSLNNDTWKNIPDPDAYIFGDNAVYVEKTGCCYWPAVLGESYGVPPFSVGRNDVLSFNFATEEFGHFPLPPVCNDEYTYFLVKCGDSLGVVTYLRPPDISGYPRDVSAFDAAQAPTITIFKRVGGNWIIVGEIAVSSKILRPVGMIGDRYLFVEVKRSPMRSQLAAYNLNSAKFKRFSVYSQPKNMRVFPSSGSNQELVDADEWAGVEVEIDSLSESEGEEEDV